MRASDPGPSTPDLDVVQLALLRLAYCELASDDRLARLKVAITARCEEEQIKFKALRDEAARKLRSHNRSQYTSLMLDYNFAELRDTNARVTFLSLCDVPGLVPLSRDC